MSSRVCGVGLPNSHINPFYQCPGYRRRYDAFNESCFAPNYAEIIVYVDSGQESEVSRLRVHLLHRSPYTCRISAWTIGRRLFVNNILSEIPGKIHLVLSHPDRLLPNPRRPQKLLRKSKSKITTPMKAIPQWCPPRIRLPPLKRPQKNRKNNTMPNGPRWRQQHLRLPKTKLARPHLLQTQRIHHHPKKNRRTGSNCLCLPNWTRCFF